jgi:hypothetical protein
MERVFILISSVLFALSACSKNKNTVDENDPFPSPEPTKVEAVGTWTLYSSTWEGNSSSNIYNSAAIPCMSNNKFVIVRDNTAYFKYTGNDTCYLQKDPNLTIKHGQKGDSIACIWSQEENIFRYKWVSGQGGYGYGWLETQGSSKRLTVKDTMPSGLIITEVYKQ